MSDVRTQDAPERMAKQRGDTPGGFIWYELMTTDPAGAKRFYDQVVSGWSVATDSVAPGIDYRMINRSDGKMAGGVLTLLVEGAHAPLIQHLTPMILERVNRFFGYAAVNRIVFKQGKPPAPEPKQARPQLRPVPKELGEGLREIADPGLRACLESLAARIAASSGPPSLDEGSVAIPVIKGVK